MLSKYKGCKEYDSRDYVMITMFHKNLCMSGSYEVDSECLLYAIHNSYVTVTYYLRIDSVNVLYQLREDSNDGNVISQIIY